MFEFSEDYHRGKEYRQAWQFVAAGLAVTLSYVYFSHPDGYLYSAAIWDGLLGEECDGEIRAYRIAHAQEIRAEVERLLASDADARNIVGLTLLLKAYDCAAHGNRDRAERLLNSPSFRDFPTPLPAPEAFQKMAMEYFTKHAPSKSVRNLVSHCAENERVCPQPQKWGELYEMLPNKRRAGGSWEPPLPFIQATWHDTPYQAKRHRLMAHILWAERQGQLDRIERYLRSLREEDWHHNSSAA
jgi:hypothetical protein